MDEEDWPSKDEYLEQVKDRIGTLAELDRKAIEQIVDFTEDLQVEIQRELLRVTALDALAGRKADEPSYEMQHYQAMKRSLDAEVGRWTDRVEKVATEAVNGAGELGAEHPILAKRRARLGTGELPTSFPHQIAAARVATSELVRNLGKDARKELDQTLRLGATGALSLERVQRRVAKIVDVPSRPQEQFGGLAYQAARITRTEIGRTFALANVAAEEEVVALAPDAAWQTVWIHSGQGAGARLHHVALHGTKVDRDKTFLVNGHPAKHPQDPSLPAEEVINCRCTSALVMRTWATGSSLFPPGSERRKNALRKS